MSNEIDSNSLNYPPTINASFNFRFILTCYVLALVTIGFGDYLFGYFLYMNVSTLFIYIALVFQILTRSFHLPKILITLYIFILIQTFVLNYNSIDINISFKHFLGIVLYTLSIFSFIRNSYDRILKIIKIYYNFVFIISCIAFLQLIIFLIFGYSFFPQNIFSGIHDFEQGTSPLKNEILGVFPRLVGLSTEPAHFIILTLPGTYLSLLRLLNKSDDFNFNSTFKSLVILISFVLSFSVVGYFGLALCLLFILGKGKGKLVLNILMIAFFSLVLYVFSKTTIYTDKISILPEILTNYKEYEYSSSSQTQFALLSNIAIAETSLNKSMFLGTGLNTHQISYYSEIYNIFTPNQVYSVLNSADAGSLFIRITSEFGIPGILAFIFFLYHFKLGREAPTALNKTINEMCFIFLITYSVRNGSYMGVNLMLFTAMFFYSYLSEKGKISIHS